MELLKRYQVAEHEDGKWSVIDVGQQVSVGSQLITSILGLSDFEFNTAAEAQEVADELNGVNDYENANIDSVQG